MNFKKVADTSFKKRGMGEGGEGGGLLNRQNPLSVTKFSYLSTVPKLTVCAKPVTFIQENTLGGWLPNLVCSSYLIFYIHSKTDPAR